MPAGRAGTLRQTLLCTRECLRSLFTCGGLNTCTRMGYSNLLTVLLSLIYVTNRTKVATQVLQLTFE